MKIIKVADYCGGDYGEPKGHLDSQVFPCKKDPSETARKKKKKKKASEDVSNLPVTSSDGLNWYKKAAMFEDHITGPDMSKLTPSRLEEAKRWLEEKHPNINWTMEMVIDFINKNFIGKQKPFTGPKDIEHGF